MKKVLTGVLVCLVTLQTYSQNSFSAEVAKILRMVEKKLTISDCDRPGRCDQLVVCTILLDSLGGISSVNFLSIPDSNCNEELRRIACRIQKEWTAAKSEYTTILIPIILLFPDFEADCVGKNAITEKLHQFFLRNNKKQLLPDMLVTRPLSITYYRSRGK